jgi:hypothetical protein
MCMDGVVMTMQNCAWTVTARCPYGCKIGASFEPGSDAFCNETADGGGDAPSESGATAGTDGSRDGGDASDGQSDSVD